MITIYLILTIALLYCLYRALKNCYECMLQDLKEAREIYQKIKEDKKFFDEVLTK